MLLTQPIQRIADQAAGDEDAGHSGRFLRVGRGYAVAMAWLGIVVVLLLVVVIAIGLRAIFSKTLTVTRHGERDR